MKFLSVLLLINILALHTLCDNAENVTNVSAAPEPFPNTLAPSTTDKPTTLTPAPTTAPPTSPSPTPTPPPTTASPTTPSTTTTTTTTTTKTTSVTPTTTSSTTPPTPTSPNPSTTPAPPPKPKQGTWSVSVTNTTYQSTCILVKMAAFIEVNYTNADNNTGEGQVSIPIDANSSGSCGESGQKEQYIQLTWPVTGNYNNTLKFVFSKNNSKFELEDIYVNLVLDKTNFPNAKDSNKTYTLVGNKTYFSTPEKMSYKCDKDTTLPLNVTTTNTTGNVTVGILKISLFQFQAFGNITKEHFDEAIDCEPYETPDIVPIAVGCALMALIIIVLIGYLIGRRRNQARGYLSM